MEIENPEYLLKVLKGNCSDVDRDILIKQIEEDYYSPEAIIDRIDDGTITKKERDEIRERIKKRGLINIEDCAVIRKLFDMCNYDNITSREHFERIVESRKQQIIDQIVDWYKFQMAYFDLNFYYAGLMGTGLLDEDFGDNYEDVIWDEIKYDVEKTLEVCNVFEGNCSRDIIAEFDEMDQDEAKE